MDPNGPAYGTVLKPDENQPDPQHLRRTFVEDLGVTRESDVVVYDNEQNRRAARIVWTLRFFGYSRVAVLDGGLAAWRGAEGSLETRENSPADVPQPPIDPQQKADWYLVTGELMSELTDPDLVLLDSRTEDERADDVDETIDPGSIPNSVEAPWTSTMSDTHGYFLSPPELRALFESAGVTPNRRIVIYARFGVETAHTWLALKLLGYEHVLIYDSGWVDWAQRPDTPKQPLLQ